MTRWIFDVELLARLIRQRKLAAQSPAHRVLYELPLDHWVDVAGSKLKSGDFAKASIELLRIYRRYLLHPTKAAPPVPHTVSLPLGRIHEKNRRKSA